MASACLWALATECVCVGASVVLWAINYLPARVDGWYYWTLAFYIMIGSFLGVFISVGVLVWRLLKEP